MKTVVIGLQYGDCGKGRVVGYFSKDYDWAIRFSGGGNAGHSIYDEQGRMFKLHHIPCGVVYGKKVALDTGMVIDLKTLNKEIKTLKDAGFDPDIYVSENVHLVTEEHIKSDSDGSGIGSTKRGIAYVYADRARRRGIRVSSSYKVMDDLRKNWAGHSSLTDVFPAIKRYKGLPPIAAGESAIYEGAQGIMLDVDYGAYPYVTSSSIMPSMAHRIDKTIGVMKAYTTRVGDGPPYYEDMENIRIAGGEFGTTTGRPRMCFWNDLQQIDYAISIVQPDEIVVTKLDVLKDIKDIHVYDEGKLRKIGNLDTYKHFLAYRFPQIKWFSESPYGEMTEVR